MRNASVVHIQRACRMLFDLLCTVTCVSPQALLAVFHSCFSDKVNVISETGPSFRQIQGLLHPCPHLLSAFFKAFWRFRQKWLDQFIFNDCFKVSFTTFQARNLIINFLSVLHKKKVPVMKPRRQRFSQWIEAVMAILMRGQTWSLTT